MPNFDLARDLPVLFSMVLLRVVLPLAIVFALGWVLWRLFAPREAEARGSGFSEFAFRVRGGVPPVRLPRLSSGAILILSGVSLLWIAAIGFLIARYFYGLDKATALNDYMPWGLWIAFKLACVACAAGGFTFAATVYVFRLDQYRPIARTAILTGLLGYSTFVISLLIDLGRWYNIWHPVVMWNFHSVMFEVAWCVMLYLAVLLLEFSPAVFERLHWKRAIRFIHSLTLPIVIAGVILSTLHQSSLGSLYLIMEPKLYPLWHTVLLPVLFFTSAVATGIAMMIVVPAINASLFKARVPDRLLGSLTRPASVVLAIYLVLKLGDLAYRGEAYRLLQFNSYSLLYWGELLIGVVVPLIIFLLPRARRDRALRYRTAWLVIAGTVLNWFNVAVFGFGDFLNSVGAQYVPSLGEWVITLALLTGAIAVYVAAVKLLPVLPEPERERVIAE